MDKEIKRLHKVSHIKGTYSILIEWFMIAIAIYASESLNSVLFTIAVLFFIAGRQHALAFCVHEGVHYLVSSHKKLNDFFVNGFAAWPMFMEVKTYRGNHLAHHRYNNTEKDPDWVRKNNEQWVFPRNKEKLFFDFTRSFFGLESLKTFYALSGLDAQKKGLTAKTGISKNLKFLKIFYYLTFAVLFIKLDIWDKYLLYWILPLFTWLQVLNRMRKISEHFGLYNENPDLRTRTVVPNILEQIFIAPKNISYHCEHHYYPQVPYYNLKKLHKKLLKNKEKPMHVTYGYWNVLKECL
ncbi:MAG: fatty acid desaturase family protein [Halobacteriovoraceae bacterium]|nr:fatty acid desaturase family protein [Halobacteriovoraceae bacterium]MCB9094096.1 fatty acid desaturase family protein [Halobacteriovoraceae bacterium]